MVELHGIYTVDNNYKVIYLPPNIFNRLYKSIIFGKKVYFITVDNKEHLIIPQQQIKYLLPQPNISQNNQYQQTIQYLPIPFRIEPFFYYTDRVSIEEYKDKIIFRDLKTIPIWALEQQSQNEKIDLELPHKPIIAPGSSIEVKIPRRGRKAFLEVWEE